MSGGRLAIPRVIHRIWFGQAIPEDFQRYGETWRQHHPGWEMRLWTQDNLPALSRPSALERARHAAERANILRYELLCQFGGVYVDTDMECLRCIEPLLGGVEAFAGYQRPGEVCNAILGAVPEHPAFLRAVEEAARRVGLDKSSVRATGPRFVTELLADFPEVRIFEPTVFYPYDWTQEPVPASELPHAYAIHHWSRTGKEPSDPDAKVEYLRQRVAGLRRSKRKAQRRAASARTAAKGANRRARRSEAQLAAVQSSLWWRLRPTRLVPARARSALAARLRRRR